MNNESQLTEQESLELIARMINKAKSDFRETGIGALMWGTIITVCAPSQTASADANCQAIVPDFRLIA